MGAPARSAPTEPKTRPGGSLFPEGPQIFAAKMWRNACMFTPGRLWLPAATLAGEASGQRGYLISRRRPRRRVRGCHARICGAELEATALQMLDP
jgi:hypothetical protein